MVPVIKGRVVPKLMIVWLYVWVSINQISGKRQPEKNTVLQRSIRMYNNPLMSDIKFTCNDCHPGEEFIYAHKYMLATSSSVFQQMFYGDLPTTDSVIDLQEVSKVVLKAFLAYIYKDECPDDIAIMFGVLRLTKKYKIPWFDEACRNDLEQKALEKITAKQAFEFLEKSVELNEHTMMEFCLRYIDKYTDTFFASQNFLNIKHLTLDSLLARDTLSSNEKAIFEAVVKWADHQCSLRNLEKIRENRREILGDAIYKIRFHTMTASKFFGELSTWELVLSDSEIIGLQKAMSGENVQNLKWDLSKQKRGVRTYFEAIIETGRFCIFILLIGYASLNFLRTRDARPFDLFIVVCSVIGYYYSNVVYKFIQKIHGYMY